MIVEEERRRMLQQNVDRLVGHIPKGVLSEVSSLSVTICTAGLSPGGPGDAGWETEDHLQGGAQGWAAGPGEGSGWTLIYPQLDS